MTPPKLSVIVPVYNASKYLSKCIDSILHQDFHDFELILVNDGSTDDSGKICDEFSQNDRRIHFFHQPNGGASSARNTGIENASGKYLCFIDADDFVTPQYLNGLLEDIELEKDIDLVIQGTRKLFPDGKIKKFIPKDKIIHLPVDDKLYYSVYQYLAPYSKLFRHDIVEEYHLRFNTNLVVAEDYDFLLRYLFHSHKLHVSDKANYYYYSNDGSLSSRIYSFEQEYTVYHNAYDLATTYSDRYNQGEWFSFPSFLLCRTLFSNYLNVYGRKQRMEHLNSFSDKELRIFNQNFKADTLFLKLVRFLFTHRLNSILDILLHWRITPNKK